MFDLIIFPLSLETGQERYDLPGLLVLSATRKAARMRAQDHLALYCKLHTIAGSSAGASSPAQPGVALTQAQLREILTRLAETYFTFSGSITAGLRVVAARLNDFLLNRNLKSAHEGQIVATLNMAVIHGDRLVVAHAGATHSFLLAQNEVLHFDDGQAGRGLGLSRQIIPRFYQASLNAGDLLVLCADPPASWNERTLVNSPQLSFDHLRRRLTSDAGIDLQAGIVRFQAGKGQVSYWRTGETAHFPGKTPVDGRRAPRREASPGSAVQKEAPAPYEPAADAQASANEPAAARAEPEATPGGIDQVLAMGVTTVESSQEDSEKTVASAEVFLGLTGDKRTSEQEAPAAPHQVKPQQIPQADRIVGRASDVMGGQAVARPGIRRESGRAAVRSKESKHAFAAPSTPRQPGAFQKRLAALGDKARQGLKNTGLFLVRMGRDVSKGLARIIPRQYDAEGHVIPFFNLSTGQMLAIAIIIPLVVVAVGTTVYARLGVTEEFHKRLQSAKEYAQQASQLKDPVQQREGWRQAYALLLEANKLGVNDETLALKKQIVDALDELDGIIRLDYQPAISGNLPSGVIISGIVTTLNDVYLLDSSQGRILRLYRVSSSYDIDPTFNCGPGQAGAIIINPLIDLVSLPTNNEMHSTVMGIDAGGNLVYCAPNLTGFDSVPLALPDSGWGNIVGMTLYGNTLYVLDPKANAVYRYDGLDGVFNNPPHLYFDNIIPQMNDIIDLAVDQEFLYLLHADGRMTVCQSSDFAFAATKCTDPAPYGDSRPGYEPAPLSFAGSHFTHIQTTEPPDPSLFSLDSANKSIYHLSLRRLNLQRQYRAVINGNFPLPNEAATAFAIAPNRRVLVAFGNKLFFAALP